MNDEVKYTYKTITLAACITKKSRKKMNKKIENMAKMGWELEAYIDGGMTNSCTAMFKRDINYQEPKMQRIIAKIFTYILYLLLGFILLAIMIPKSELTPKEKEKIAIEK